MKQFTTVTENEKEVILAINSSDYGDQLGDPVWTDTVESDCPSLNGKQMSGVISSLSQKGLVESQQDGRESTIWLTSEGIEVAKENNLLGKFA